MNGNCIACQEKPSAPRVVVVGLASCFGCQLQVTNAEAHLLDVLGQIDLRYWQLASSDPMPEDFDVAIIEGAVTTEEAEATVRSLRAKAAAIIAVGACATTAGIPGMAADGFLERPGQVYERVPSACGDMVAPRAVGAVIDVDYEVRACPIDSYDFIDVLQRALYGPRTRRILAHDVRRLQAQRDELLLRKGAAVPGARDHGRVRREVR